MGLFKPKWQSIKYGAGEKAVAKISDEALLLKIALEAPAWPTCIAALAKLSAAASIGRVACEHRAARLRSLALERLQDQVILAHIAQNDSDSEIRLAAVQRLTDEQVLTLVALNDPYRPGSRNEYTVREAALERIHDCQSLTEVALKSTVRQIAEKAVSRITNEACLFKLVLTAQSFGVNLSALAGLQDEKYLLPVALQFDDDLALAAAWRINSPAALTRIALEAVSDKARSQVLERLEDEDLFAKVLATDKSWGPRLSAAKRIRNQEILSRTARKDREARVRRTATLRLADNVQLEQIALKDKDLEVRRAAITALERNGGPTAESALPKLLEHRDLVLSALWAMRQLQMDWTAFCTETVVALLIKHLRAKNEGAIPYLQELYRRQRYTDEIGRQQGFVLKEHVDHESNVCGKLHDDVAALIFYV